VTWLYIYGYYEEAVKVCDLLSEIEFMVYGGMQIIRAA